MGLVRVLLASLAVTSAICDDIYVPGGGYPGCPASLSFITNWNMPRFQGAWYAQFLHFNTMDLGCTDGCVSVYHTLNYPNHIKTNFCCQKDGTLICPAGLGSGTVSNYSAVGGGNVIYSAFGNDLQAFTLGDTGDWFLGYQCGFFPDGTHYEGICGYSRTPNPGQAYVDWVNGLLDRNGICRSLAIGIGHGPQCRYPFGCPSTSCSA